MPAAQFCWNLVFPTRRSLCEDVLAWVGNETLIEPPYVIVEKPYRAARYSFQSCRVVWMQHLIIAYMLMLGPVGQADTTHHADPASCGSFSLLSNFFYKKYVYDDTRQEYQSKTLRTELDQLRTQAKGWTHAKGQVLLNWFSGTSVWASCPQATPAPADQGRGTGVQSAELVRAGHGARVSNGTQQSATSVLSLILSL